MKQQSQQINFQCNQCGKCCTETPSVNLYEMISLSDEFIFQTAHHVFLSTTKNLLDKSKLWHFQRLGHAIVIPELESTLFYYINFKPIDGNKSNQCIKLKNNLCSIYGKRPDICKISPGSFYHPLDHQDKIIYFQEQSKNGWACDFSEEAPEFFNKKQEFNTIALQNTYQKNISFTQDITDLFIQSMSDKEKQEHFESLYMSFQNNGLIVSDIISILIIALQHGRISAQDIETFLNNQISLLKLRLKLNFKIFTNINTFFFYKKKLNQYLELLKNKPYINKEAFI